MGQIFAASSLTVRKIMQIERIIAQKRWLLGKQLLRHFLRSSVNTVDSQFRLTQDEKKRLSTSGSSFPSNPSPGFNKTLISFAIRPAAEIICEGIYYKNKCVRPSHPQRGMMEAQDRFKWIQDVEAGLNKQWCIVARPCRPLSPALSISSWNLKLCNFHLAWIQSAAYTTEALLQLADCSTYWIHQIRRVGAETDPWASLENNQAEFNSTIAKNLSLWICGV